jgi:hypothetical protein
MRVGVDTGLRRYGEKEYPSLSLLRVLRNLAMTVGEWFRPVGADHLAVLDGEHRPFGGRELLTGRSGSKPDPTEKRHIFSFGK